MDSIVTSAQRLDIWLEIVQTKGSRLEPELTLLQCLEMSAAIAKWRHTLTNLRRMVSRFLHQDYITARRSWISPTLLRELMPTSVWEDALSVLPPITTGT